MGNANVCGTGRSPRPVVRYGPPVTCTCSRRYSITSKPPSHPATDGPASSREGTAVQEPSAGRFSTVAYCATCHKAPGHAEGGRTWVPAANLGSGWQPGMALEQSPQHPKRVQALLTGGGDVAVGCTPLTARSPASHSRVLPVPLGPMNPNSCASPTVKDTSSSARTSHSGASALVAEAPCSLTRGTHAHWIENVCPWSWGMRPTRLDILSVIGVSTIGLGRRWAPARRG
jgi:hypothetical protein